MVMSAFPYLIHYIRLAIQTIESFIKHVFIKQYFFYSYSLSYIS